MANGGWCGTDAEWARLEAPLSQVDAAIDAFAARKSLSVLKNERESVGRSMRWGGNPSALLQLYLNDLDKLTWNLWHAARKIEVSPSSGRRVFLSKGKRLLILPRA